MQKRPSLNIQPSKLDKFLEIIAVVLLLSLWLSCFWALQHIGPEKLLPIHFNLKGIPDKYGSKNSLLLPPIMATVLYSGITFLNKFPETFNYIRPITMENAHAAYTRATRLMRWLKIGLVFVFCYLEASILLEAYNIKPGLSNYFSLFFLTILLLPTAWYLIQTIRKIG